MPVKSIRNVVGSKNCTGCTLCLTSCERKAISIDTDNEGFTIPYVDETLCNDCGRCLNICPVNSVDKANIVGFPKVYAMRTTNKSLLKKCASGGIFSEIAKYFFRKNYYVCAARWNNDYTEVFHDLTNKKEDLEAFLGSKYVQSNMTYIYEKLYDTHKMGKHVLFCGTPCQVAAVKNWAAAKKIENIFTCDILCFGVPSPKVYKAYRSYLINKYKSNIKKLNFRSKKRGWCNYSVHVEFENKKHYIKGKFDDPYYRGFIGQMMSRYSCYNCKFADIPKQGDITIGDLWGAEKGFYNFWGVSVVIVNNLKGENLINKLVADKKIKAASFSIESALPFNKRLMDGTAKILSERVEFYNILEKEGFEFLVREYLKPQPFKVKFGFTLKHQLKRIFEETF